MKLLSKIKKIISRIMWKFFKPYMAYRTEKREHECLLNQLKKYDEYDIEDWIQLDKNLYKHCVGRDLDLDNPQSFTEKIQWRKIYDNHIVYSILSDKYLVREWVQKKIGKQYLIPLLGVWEDFDKIDFNKLPNSFVLKANNGSATNVIVKNKSTIKKKYLREKFDFWLSNIYGVSSCEQQYRRIKPLIIAETYLEPDDGYSDLTDYKFFCFNGVPKFCEVHSNRTTNHEVAEYDMEWNRLPWVLNESASDLNIKKPAQFDILYKCAKKLCDGFAHVRVDLYVNGGQVFFGEMTFTDGSGLYKTNPLDADLTVGQWWNISGIQVDEEKVGIDIDKYLNKIRF